MLCPAPVSGKSEIEGQIENLHRWSDTHQEQHVF